MSLTSWWVRHKIRKIIQAEIDFLYNRFLTKDVVDQAFRSALSNVPTNKLLKD